MEQRKIKTPDQRQEPKDRRHLRLFLVNLLIIVLVLFGVGLLRGDNQLVVEAAVVNLRTGPGISYNVDQQLPQGTQLTILEEKNNWYKVSLADGSKGWIANWLIGNTTASPNTNIAATVKADNTKLRKTGSSDGEVTQTLTKGTSVTITLQQDNWSQVQVDDQEGWIKSSELTITTSPTTDSTATTDSSATTASDQQTQTIYTRETSTNVRADASVNSDIVTTLEQGIGVKVLETSGDWFKIETPDGQTGWVANWVMDYQKTSNALVTSIAEATIMLDAGHGGEDGGASTKNERYNEKDLTLSTVKKVQAALEKTGAKVLLTRDDDSSVGLVARSDMSNAQKPDVFISIHYDATEDANIATGTHTFYYYDRDQQLATIVNRHLADLPLKNNGASFNDLSVTRENTQPALLLELGYLSTDSDVSYIITDSYQQQVADAITAGLTEYFQ